MVCRQRGTRHRSRAARLPGGRRGSGDCRDAADATQEQEAEEKDKKLSFAYAASALRAKAVQPLRVRLRRVNDHAARIFCV